MLLEYIANICYLIPLLARTVILMFSLETSEILFLPWGSVGFYVNYDLQRL